jgi:hypothetical protein
VVRLQRSDFRLQRSEVRLQKCESPLLWDGVEFFIFAI